MVEIFKTSLNFSMIPKFLHKFFSSYRFFLLILLELILNSRPFSFSDFNQELWISLVAGGLLFAGLLDRDRSGSERVNQARNQSVSQELAVDVDFLGEFCVRRRGQRPAA